MPLVLVLQEDHGRRSGTYVAGRGVVTDVVVEGGKVDVIVEEDIVVVEHAWRRNYCPIKLIIDSLLLMEV